MALTEFMLSNPKKLKEKKLPDHVTVYPVESTDSHQKCERCKVNTADGFMPLAKSKQVVVN